MDTKEFARIREKKLRVTQAELARQLGVSRAAVSRWESGKRKIDPVLALAMNCLVERESKGRRGKRGK